jgi:hypothetical protein
LQDFKEEQEKALRKLTESVSKDVDELRRQEKSLRELAETVESSLLKLAERVQNVVIVRSKQLGDETRLRALWQLSQQVDSLSFPPLLEILKGSGNGIGLRCEAAYGLGRYSEDPAFKEYYPEIISGFCEVLGNHETSRELVFEVIKSASQFEADPGGLAPSRCIPILLEILKNRASETKPRVDVARVLGWYSRNLSLKEYHPDIVSGFREVLENTKTPRELALETIKSARLFRTEDSDELIPPFNELVPLFETWERRDAQAGLAEG